MPRGMRGIAPRAVTHIQQTLPEKFATLLDAYHRHIQIELIAQGTLQYLAVRCPRLVWASFGGWLCTIRRERRAITSRRAAPRL
jgi:hypothetical protein